jgi:hypothetical protein
LTLNPALVLRDEPLSRGRGSKPHWAEFCVREGGEFVYVCFRYPDGVREAEYQRILRTEPYARNLNWVSRFRNPTVYVRGRIRHSDHKTIVLNDWHRVLMNTENQATAMRHVAFLD